MKKPFCIYPFYFMEFAFFGKVFSCCPAHVKKEIGNIENETILDIWNGDYVRYMRSELLKGTWETICDPTCPFVHNFIYDQRFVSIEDLVKANRITASLAEEISAGKTKLSNMPTVFNFCNTDVCNLDCIMCCCKGLKTNPEITRKTFEDAFKYLPTIRVLTLSGAGDPFACPDTLKLLTNFEGHKYPKAKIQLLTNGLLLPRYWNQVKHNNFSSIGISIDAATNDTYELIRKNGKWDQILDTLEFVNSIRERFSGIVINMTVMKENFREIPDFIKLGIKYNFIVSFNEVRTEGNASIESNIFANRDGAEFGEFISLIKAVSQAKYPIYINWGNLLSYTVI